MPEIGAKLISGGQVTAIHLAWSLAGGILAVLLFAWMLPKTRLKRFDLVALVWLVLSMGQRRISGEIWLPNVVRATVKT